MDALLTSRETSQPGRMPFIYATEPRKLKHKAPAYYRPPLAEIEVLLRRSPTTDLCSTVEHNQTTVQGDTLTIGRRSQRTPASTVTETRDIGTLLQRPSQSKMVHAEGYFK
ncbi:Hypothetical predicted protein [Pelobates cultripes]|uniref:Uncharacterized protein n=1 Tax=Pelobates cultripes TaxID=61616 RepID=A0AAD1REQ5_PELCU|nr:Hypothetical predicted protein [Pelobates cultripes]